MDSKKPPSAPPAVSSQSANGHHPPPDNSTNESTTKIVENGRSDHDLEDEIDNDDDQWSDWEHDAIPPESSTEVFQPTPSAPPSTIEEQIISKPVNSSNKTLKLSNMSKSKWNPDAPLGSEYEIPPVVLKKQKSVTTSTSNNQEMDDFFKDMAPKVQTVELMHQLETMFHVNADQPNEQSEPRTTRTTKTTVLTSPSTTFSNKFGVMSPDHDDNQELNVENNNWDE